MFRNDTVRTSSLVPFWKQKITHIIPTMTSIYKKHYPRIIPVSRLSSIPTLSYFLGLFVPFSYFSSENSYFYFFAIKCQNNFSYQEKLGLQESAPFNLQLLEGIGIPAKFHDFNVMLTNLKDSHDLTIFFLKKIKKTTT